MQKKFWKDTIIKTVASYWEESRYGDKDKDTF